MLSISLTDPTLHATEMMAPLSFVTTWQGRIVSLSSTATYWISLTNGSCRSIFVTICRRESAETSTVVERNTSLAAHRPLNKTGAAARSRGDRYEFRDDIARPFGSRTVSSTTQFTSMFRSSTIRRISTHWAASFWPKYALVGCTMLSSLVTIVATPRKCPGRARPSDISSNPCHGKIRI